MKGPSLLRPQGTLHSPAPPRSHSANDSQTLDRGLRRNVQSFQESQTSTFPDFEEHELAHRSLRPVGIGNEGRRL